MDRIFLPAGVVSRISHGLDESLGAEKKPPALFLLDEILHGTNSHDPAIGAKAIVGGLLDRSAIGLVTTHDLALAGVADALGQWNEHEMLTDGERCTRHRFGTGNCNGFVIVWGTKPAETVQSLEALPPVFH